MMLKTLVLLLSVAVVTVSCSKKPANLILVNSPFQFVHDKSLRGTEFVAQLGEDKITTSQLMSPSPALIELDQRINDIILRKVYAMAGSEGAITFAFEEPKDGLKKMLGKDFKEGITAKFDPKITTGVALIDDKAISADELSKDDMLLSRLMSSRFEQNIKALEGLFARRKVLEASTASNINMEEFIKTKILGGGLTATDADVNAFALKNNISEKELTEELRAQIKDTIMSHQRETKITAYVAENLISSPIHVAFTKPTMTVSVPTVNDSAPHLGEGPISELFFSRWDCENCKAVGSAVSGFVDSHAKHFKMSYLFNFPPNSNEERMVAEASLCLKKQSETHFWKFLSAFDPKSNDNLEEAVNLAVKSSGGNFEAFRTCFLAREFKDQVEAHLQATKDFGFYRSPVVVLDGKVMEVPTSDDFVESALALKAEKGLGFNFFYKIKQFFKNL
ncbi:MAG: thioredoxin domain-containing protein [Bdellovibrionaceae bacterium]|nr:thioredoxin domain-containing protein [Pseudobdellovibrionaceae bacterium]